MNETINSGTAAYLSVSFTDKDGIPSPPSTVYATVLLHSPLTIIRPETALPSPGTTMEIMITAAENTLTRSSVPLETRHVKLRAVYGVGDEFVTTYDYKIRNAN